MTWRTAKTLDVLVPGNLADSAGLAQTASSTARECRCTRSARQRRQACVTLQLLQRLQARPRHVLVNLTPMHPTRSFFTLQNLSIAICPYRVMSVPDFTASMEALGYCMLDHWQSFERSLRIPFEPECTVDSYHGFHFSLPAAHGPAA